MKLILASRPRGLLLNRTSLQPTSVSECGRAGRELHGYGVFPASISRGVC
jgi:hypothetical protein